MVWQKQQAHKAASYRIQDLSSAGAGGLNIQDVDYSLPMNQSPHMLNMMVKNGTFGKRYGQSVVHSFSGKIRLIARYEGSIYVLVDNRIVKWANGNETQIYASDKLSADGIFINFNKILYFMNENIFLQWDGATCSEVKPYVPTIKINCTPDNKSGDTTENYNRLGSGFTQTYHGNGTATVYYITIPKEDDKDTAGLDSTPVEIMVNESVLTEGKDFSVDRSSGKITFTKAPAEGVNNVRITAYKSYSKYKSAIIKCKHYAVYGGENNSRLFLAGNGTSNYFFSDVYDATYFPDNNYASVGNAEDDVTGFGLQYSVLILFKPTEIYQLTYSFENNPSGIKQAYFYSSPVNAEMGCDMPETIRYVDNRLTWGSTQWGICTLCSTLIQDERNVRVISRNINGGYRENGLLAEPNLTNAKAFSYEGKYIVSCTSGNCYVWDFTNAPYSTSEKYTPDTAAFNLAWYKWSNMPITAEAIMDRVLYYARGNDLCTLTNDLSDFGRAINAYYRTPMMDFGKYEYLKTIKKVYFEVRGDTPCRINIKYITNENMTGEEDPEPIIVYSKLWSGFTWDTFGWTFISFANTFARKCSVKKVLLFAIELSNNEVNKDMSLSGIRCEYTYVKEIK